MIIGKLSKYIFSLAPLAYLFSIAKKERFPSFKVVLKSICKRLLTQSLDLVEILYSDAVTKAVLSVWELLFEWRLDSNSKLTIELIFSAKTKGR